MSAKLFPTDHDMSYRKAVERVCEFSWPNGPSWNAIFLDKVAEAGLRLIPWDAPLRPPAHLVYAPLPVPDGRGPHWPMSLMVPANDLPWFYRYAVGELVRISACDPASVVPWAGKLCDPLQTDYATLFTDVLETRQRRLLAFAGGLAKL